MEKSLRDLIDIIHFTENVSAKIHGVLDEAEIYRIVREEFLRSKRYAASILLLTPDGSKLDIAETSVSSRKVKEGEKAAGLRLREYKIDLKKSSIYWQVVAEGKTEQAKARDIMGELLPRPLAELISKIMGYDENRAAILTPLKRHGEIIGAFAMSSTELAEHLVPSVRNLAQHISNALELADEYAERRRAEEALKRRSEELSTLNAIASTVAGSLHLEDIMGRALDEVLESMKVEAAVITLSDPQTGEMTLITHRGLSDDFVHNMRRQRQKVGRKLADIVPAAEEAILIQDLPKDPRVAVFGADFEKERLRSSAAVALQSKGKVVGMLAVISRERHKFSSRDVELLASIGSQIGMAMENANLYHEQMQRVFEMEALRKTTLDITSQLDVPQLLRSIVERAAALVGTRAGGLYLYHAEDEELELVVSYHMDRDYTGTRVKVGEGLSGKVVQTGEPLIVGDYANWEGKSEKYDDAPLRAILGVPLKWGEKIVGVLNVNDLDRPRTFGDGELWLLEQFASQAAIAIENARLYEEQERRSQELMALHETSLHLVSELDLDSLLDAIMGLAMKLLNGRTGDVYLYRSAQGDLISAASQGMPPELEGAVVEAGEGLAGRILQTAEPLIVDDYDSWDGRTERYAGYGFGRVVGVPMKYGEDFLGALVVERGLDRPCFTEKDVNLLGLFANQGAIAIENARLYEATQARSTYLETLQRVNATLRSTLPLNEVLDTIVQGSAEALGYIGSLILVPDAAGERLVLGAVSGSRFVDAAVELTGLEVGSYRLPLDAVENPLARAFLTGEFQALTGSPELIVMGVEPTISPKMARIVRQAMGAEMAACVPLRVGQTAVGVLAVFSPKERFADGERAMLRGLADQAALAIENARLYEETAQKAEELAALYDVSLDVVGQLELGSLLEIIVQRAIELLKVDTGGLYLYDPEREELELTVHEALVRDLRGIRVSVGEGLSGKVAQSGEPLVVMDYGKWQEKSPHFDDGRSVNAFAVPIKRGNTLLGVLYVADEDVERRFAESDLRLATLLANQAAVAIENARLYQETARRAEELATLYDVSLDVAGQLELQSLLETILQRSIDLLTGHAGGLYLYDEEGQELELTVHRGLGQDYTGVRLALGEGLCGRVAETGEALTVRNYTNWEGRSPLFEHEQAVNSLAVPIMQANTLLGALWVDDPDTDREFGEADVRLARLFANQAAVAIENARLYEETGRRLKESTTLQEISRLVNSSLEPGQIFQTLVETVAAAFGYDLVHIYILEGDGLRLGAQVGYDPGEALDFIPLDKGISGRVALSGKAELVQDVSKDPDFLQAAPGIVSEITVPVKKDHKVLGVLGVESASSEPLAEADLSLISSISHQISVAIQNAQLYKETRKRLEELSVLYEASVGATSTLEFSEILERVAAVLRGTLGFSNLTVMLLDEEEQRLKIEAGIGYIPEVAEEIRPRLGEGITGYVAMTGEPQNVPDVTKDPRYIMGDKNMRSELSVPLEVGEKIIGVINVESAQLAAFSDDDLRLLSTLAGQLAVIIENARLYEQLRESEERFRSIFENAVLGLYRTTLDGRILMANPALVRMLGFSSFEELAQRNLEDEGYEPEYPRAAFKQAVGSEGQVVGLESAWKRRDGTILFIRESAKAVRDEAGNTLYYEGSVEDVTEYKRAQEALRESEERFRVLVEESPLGISMIGRDGHYEYVNPEFIEMFGYELDDIPTGREWFARAFPDEEYRAQARSAWLTDLRDSMIGEARPGIFVVTCKDGSRKVIHFRPVTMETAGQFVIYEDITDRKRAEEELQQSYVRLQRALEQTVDALASMAEKRDPYTAGHQQGVARLAVAIARTMGLSQEQVEGIRVAGIVHDIGKIYAPAEILSKPGSLTDIEFEMIKFHPQAGHDVLKTIEFPWPVGQIVLQHHERLDGSGYPQGLSGEGILLGARILAVADVVEAMASHRPYRAARSIDEALGEIQQDRGLYYDAEVVDACLRLFIDEGFGLAEK